MIYQAPFIGRANLGKLLNEKELLGEAVEVGTHVGVYAEQFLQQWQGIQLTCVDPWSIPQGYEKQAMTLEEGNPTREDDYWAASKRLAAYPHRFKLLRKTSGEAVRTFQDKSLDFVYIDGDHNYDMVLHDLVCWFPKLCAGGILAGHDFLNCDAAETVQPAVMEFYRGISPSMDLYLVTEQDCLPWSFYFMKG